MGSLQDAQNSAAHFPNELKHPSKGPVNFGAKMIFIINTETCFPGGKYPKRWM